MTQSNLKSGTILEAAFLDPAYASNNKALDIELQATPMLLAEPELKRNIYTPSQIESVKVPKKKITQTEVVVKYRGFACWKCCKTEEEIVKEIEVEDPDTKTVSSALAAEKRRIEDEQKRIKEEFAAQRASARSEAERYQKTGQPQQDLWTEDQRIAAVIQEQENMEKIRKAQGNSRYETVPEGLLIYRLDTGTGLLTLVSQPHTDTDVKTLVREMIVSHAEASHDSSRRAITFVDVNGETTTLIACDQRTAIAWLEAVGMMVGRMESEQAARDGVDNGAYGGTTGWARDGSLAAEDLATAENQYLSLAKYSNNLIRAGANVRSKAAKRAQGGVAAIYYTIEHEDEQEVDDETLESIAKRRSVIKDSWDFYRMICSLLRDRKKYDECFERLKFDPVYAYLNSMSGLNDTSGKKKKAIQPSDGITREMLPSQKVKVLIEKANAALPSLIEICKALAGSLGLEEVGVGPIKEVSASIRKAERKYDGDVLKITDYCRALLVVKDLPTLLALMELARDSFGPLIRRVKLSPLKADNPAIEGGYRDCKINIELKDHICEIQVHLWPMWLVCGVDGFRHYRHCVEYQTDTFPDPYFALQNLDRKARGEIILMAEEAVAGMPLDHLDWYHEKYILDYFAEVGLFMDHGLYAWAEVTIRRLIKLRSESPEIGVEHFETRQLQKYLERCLRAQNKNAEADEIRNYLQKWDKPVKIEDALPMKEKKSILDTVLGQCNPTWGQDDEKAYFAAEKARQEQERAEEERRLKREARASKKKWREIREERFKFLDEAAQQTNDIRNDADEP